MKLFGYWRSGATYRVRIALALKGLDYDYEPVNLLKGEQKSPAYLEKNPQGLLPALVVDDGPPLTQSLAIIEWLDETYPSPPLLPKSARLRAEARAIADIIACEAQPFGNLRIQKYLKHEAKLDDAAIKAWLDTFVGGALDAVERLIAHSAGKFCVGDQPGLADICLVPQVYAAERFSVDLSPFKRINEINARCVALPAFKKAHPDNQPDAVR
ncbi:MAG TPA: maleylacetoacetate isomerase [Parvularculaceae bacterium]|nr:maleylacetoacetate isomerase [Parvularculaceae bacterium]